MFIATSEIEPKHFFLYIFPLARLGDFVGGLLLYRLFVSVKNLSELAATATQLFSITVFIVFCILSVHVPQALRYDLYYVLPMMGIILSFAFEQGKISRLLSYGPLTLLGESSFSLYLIHQLVIRYASAYRLRLTSLLGTGDDLVFVCACLFFSLGISILMFVFFETPAKIYVLSGLCRLNAAWIKFHHKTFRFLTIRKL
jgi:peptidoglycan/LPS O-acetylase OafA/YrhL